MRDEVEAGADQTRTQLPVGCDGLQLSCRGCSITRGRDDNRSCRRFGYPSNVGRDNREPRSERFE